MAAITERGQNALATFILENLDSLLADWESFARSICSGKQLDSGSLRDHAARILRAIAADMQTEQSDAEQKSKSEGRRVGREPFADSASTSHGEDRFDEGFDINDMVSEYRALRATVIRQWHDRTEPEHRSAYEVQRFNEAIDESLAAAIARFSHNLNRARELFMGVLSHDLRAHLQVILSCSSVLKRNITDDERRIVGTHIEHSTQQIKQMVGDLLDVTRTRLGGQLPIAKSDVFAREVCEEAIRPFIVLDPDCKLEVHAPRDVHGFWDRGRILQLLSNLVRNALQHGDRSHPITISVLEKDDAVEFGVHNYGDPIPAHLAGRVFEPMQRGNTKSFGPDHSSAGLGLYIARIICRAHDGTLTVESSSEAGTTFTARLPKLDPA
jgi:signal transduction histidine kinase